MKYLKHLFPFIILSQVGISCGDYIDTKERLERIEEELSKSKMVILEEEGDMDNDGTKDKVTVTYHPSTYQLEVDLLSRPKNALPLDLRVYGSRRACNHPFLALSDENKDGSLEIIISDIKGTNVERIHTLMNWGNYYFVDVPPSN